MDTPLKNRTVLASHSLSAIKLPPLGPDSSHLQPIQDIRKISSISNEPGALEPPMADGSPTLPSELVHSSSAQNIRKKSSRQVFPAVVHEHEPLSTTELQKTVDVRPTDSTNLEPSDTPGKPKEFVPPILGKKSKKMSSRDVLTEPIMRSRQSQLFPTGIKRRVSSVLKMAGINILESEPDPVKGLWNVFDVDGDGVIDYDEFCRYTCDLIALQKRKKTQQTMSSMEAKFVRIVILEIQQLGSLQRAIESIFRVMDQNRSGRISQLEFEDGIKALGLIGYNYEVHGIKRRYADSSLFVLRVGNPIRYWAVWLVEWKWFDRFILGCIVANSIMLAFRDYQDPGSIPNQAGLISLGVRNLVIERVEVIFSWIFVVECALKVVAMGFLFGRGAYLRSYWNMLDFFVVVVGLIGDLPGVPKISALRTARVLRPLRTLSNLRGMRMLVYALFSAIPALFNVMVILCFVFTVFGILGVLFWNGVLYNRCRSTPAPVDGVWPLAGEGRLCGGAYSCPAGQYCGSVFQPPPGSYVNIDLIASAEHWDYALANFDHIGSAMLTLFQCITLEGWTGVMYSMQDAHSYVFATAYFIIFTIIGAFFLLQFVFAVIWERFNAANDGTAGEWDMILEERRASAAPAGAPTLAQVPPPSAREDSKPQLKKKHTFSQSMRNSIQSGIVVVKKKNLVHRFRKRCRRLVLNNYFSGFIIACILLNTISLAMDEYPIDPTREAVSEVINIVLTIVFSLEMLLKLVGLGWKDYRSDRFNIFDGVIVCLSLIELLMNMLIEEVNSTTGLSGLRTFRLFRIMKLARSWKSLRDLLQTISTSLADVANFGLLLLLLMYVFALIGMQFFANKFRFDDAGDPVAWQPHIYNSTSPPHAPWTPERPYTIRRSNFDDTIGAFTTVFQCLTEENWNSVMFDGVRSVGWSGALYFLFVMVVGNIIILNLFLAILLGNFSMDEVQVETATAIVRGEHMIQAASQTQMKMNAVVPISNQVLHTAAPIEEGAAPSRENRRRRRRQRSTHSASSQVERNSCGRAGDNPDDGRAASIQSQPKQGDHPRHESSGSSSSGEDSDASKATAARSGNPKQVRLATLAPIRPSLDRTPVVGAAKSNLLSVSKSDRALFIFNKTNPVRKVCTIIVHHTYFEGLMLSVIFLSSLQLSLDNPLNDPDSKLSTILATLDKSFTWIFLVEMILKVVDVGFISNGKKSYLRDPWNALDFSILMCSSATMISSNKTLRSLRSFRTLRAMRPLRVISRVPGMRRVVNALLSSIPCIMNVFLVCSLIFLIFGIIGVNLFKGRLYYCDMSSFSQETMDALETEYGFSSLSFKKLFPVQKCLEYGGVWRLHSRNYDNVLKSAMTLFELSTTEGWVALMYQGVDATEVGYHPVENWNRSYIAFFIVFIIIGSFFTMNLFVGAVIDNFNRMRDSLGSLDAENETQREWLQIQEALQATKLIPKATEPVNRIRKFCFHLQQSSKFEAVIAASVLGNTLILAITHFRQSEEVTSVLYAGNVFFWFVFLVEGVIKLMSLGLSYFNDRWNCFDFAVVCGSTVSTLLPLFVTGKISPVANTLRAFRMGLAIRLMKRAQSMQDIVNTILDNMPALVNVSTLMFIIMFVYAVIGVQLYAGIMLGESLNEHANFRSVSVAMVTLFRFGTGEAWNDVMYDLMIEPVDGAPTFPYGSSCVHEYTYRDLAAARNYTGDPDLTIGCTPGVQIVYIYFLSYQLITSYVLLNLFVAVILEGFEETTEKNAQAVTKEDLAHVCFIWERYDPLATGFVSDHDFLKFLRDVPPPLGLPKHSRRKDLEHWAKQLDLFLDVNGKISFNDFILAATQHVMSKVAAERGDNIHPARGAESFFAKSQKVVRKVARSRGSISAVPSLLAIMSVKRIQSAMRTRMARKRFLEFKQQMAAQRIMLYDKAAMSNFKDHTIAEESEQIIGTQAQPAPFEQPENVQPPRDAMLQTDISHQTEEHASDFTATTNDEAANAIMPPPTATDSDNIAVEGNSESE